MTEYDPSLKDVRLAQAAQTGAAAASPDSTSGLGSATPAMEVESVPDMAPAPSHLEKALAQSEEKLRLAVAATGLGIWSWEAQTDRVTWDERTAALFGVSMDDAPADYASYSRHIHPDDLPLVERTVAAAMQTGHYEDLEHRILLQDGSTRWVLARATIEKDIDGRPTRMVGGLMDITLQKEIQTRLAQTQRFETVGQLAQGIAHNFNNVLMSVIPNIEMALLRASGPDRACLESALEGAERGAELVRQLLAFVGPQKVRVERIDTPGWVASNLAVCRSTMSTRISVVHDACSTLPAVEGDPHLLSQAFMNVVLNARDALKSPGVTSPVLTISERVLPGGSPELSHPSCGDPTVAYLRLSVKDNGPGMSKAVQERAFDPFFTTKPVGSGTGLGLSATAGIVREHGGFVAFSSEQGKGTTVHIFLPITEAVSAMPIETHSGDAPNAPRAVLVIDDEAVVRMTIEKMVELGGHSSEGASDGAAALELLREKVGHFQLVLLDVSMPGMPGPEVREKIREIDASLPVVFLSGHAADAIGEGVGDPVLQKPIRAQRLLDTIIEYARPAIRASA